MQVTTADIPLGIEGIRMDFTRSDSFCWTITDLLVMRLAISGFAARAKPVPVGVAAQACQRMVPTASAIPS